jgi:hypothetical protein
VTDTDVLTTHPSLDVLSARELCSLPDPPGSPELLGPLVRRKQRVVIGAPTGEGKTTFALQVVRAIVAGEDFLGWQGVGDVRALVIDAEQERSSIKAQLRDAGLDGSDAVDFLCVPDGLALDGDGEQVEAVEHIVAAGDYTVVVADPLYKLHRGDSNDEPAATDLMRLLDGWREQYGFALISPVHCRKRQQKTRFGIDDLFGSSAYPRGAEVVLGLQLVRDGYSRLHFLKSRDAGLPVRKHWGLLFERGHGFRHDLSETQPSTLERLSELRAADPALTQAQAVEALGAGLRTVQRWWQEAAPEAQTSLLDEDDE